MKIFFHMGAPHLNQVNTMTLGGIKDRAQLEAIKLITNTSDFLFNGFGEASYTASGSEKSYTAHNLIIYLPNHDKSFKPYGNFEYLFTHDKYLNWKKMITAEFPELSDQFIFEEKEAKNRQELYRSAEELKRYTQKTGRYSFHRDEAHIKLLQERVTKLRQELYPEDKHRCFDFQHRSAEQLKR